MIYEKKFKEKTSFQCLYEVCQRDNPSLDAEKMALSQVTRT